MIIPRASLFITPVQSRRMLIRIIQGTDVEGNQTVTFPSQGRSTPAAKTSFNSRRRIIDPQRPGQKPDFFCFEYKHASYCRAAVMATTTAMTVANV